MKQRIWIIDTSSIIAVRQMFTVETRRAETRKLRKMLFDAMAMLIAQHRLYFPVEVFRELKEGNKSQKAPHDDLPFHFVKDNQKVGQKRASMEYVQRLMQDPGTRRMIDPKPRTGRRLTHT